MAGLGKRGSSVNSDNPACTAQGLSCTVPEDASCSSDDELLFANPPQLYHSQGHDLDQVPALSRMKTVWRDVSTAWQERRAVAGASISNSSSEARAFDASTELAQMECAQQEPQAFKAPRKLAGSRVQLSRTKTMTLSDTWWILREMGHGIEEDDEIEAGTQAMESSYRPAAGVFDLRRLPPVILRRPSQAANQRLPPPRVACGRKSKPASKAKRFEMREDAGCPARPEEESTLVETILTLVLKASSMAMRSLSLNGLGEALPVMLNAEADGEARLRAMLALMRTGAHLLLVVYVLATVFATGRWLCSILRPALWPLITIFKIARWIISS